MFTTLLTRKVHGLLLAFFLATTNVWGQSGAVETLKLDEAIRAAIDSGRISASQLSTLQSRYLGGREITLPLMNTMEIVVAAELSEEPLLVTAPTRS